MGWQDAPITSEAVPAAPYTGPERRQVAREDQQVAHGVGRAFEAGVETSVAGLYARGKLPDLVLDPSDTKWYESLAATVGQVIPDLPVMALGRLAGALAGAPGGPVTSLLAGGAGTFALPTLLRESLMRAYEAHEVQTPGEFLTRTQIAIDTGKSALVGAATFGAGVLAAKSALVGAETFGAGALAEPLGSIASGVASVGTMTIAPALLDGKLPAPQDFLNAAVLVGGSHVAGFAAKVVESKLRTIYARTGIPPEQVAADAIKDPALATELSSAEEGVPGKYKPVEQEVIGRLIVPGEKAAEVMASPFPELPDQTKGPEPTEVHLKYINSTQDVKAAMTRLSEVYEADIQVQRQGTITHRQMIADSEALLKSSVDGQDIRLFLEREPGTPAGYAEIVARKRLLTAAANDMAIRARDYAAKISPTGEDTAAFLLSIERAGIIQSEFLGARAEIGRAFNALKIAVKETDKAHALKDILSRYHTDPATLAKMIAELDTPEGILKFSRNIKKATTWEQFIEGWVSGLVSGPITHVANILGTTTFDVSRIPIDILAGAIRKVKGGEGAEMGEAMASIVGITEGAKTALVALNAAIKIRAFPPGAEKINALRIPIRFAYETLKTEAPRLSLKGEEIQPAIPGMVGKIVRIPVRALATEDLFLYTFNKYAEANRLAFRQAMHEGFDPSSREFRERMVDIVQNPNLERVKEIDAAANRFIFASALGSKGQLVQRLVKGWHLEMQVPFIKVIGNITKELTRMSPAAPLIGEWREDMLAGGVRADKATAEILFGSIVAGIAYSAAAAGLLSGSGDPDIGKKRIDAAAGKQNQSIKLGDKWYNLTRIQPLGTLIGIVADLYEIEQHMTPEERDKIPKMIGIAFANAVTNQTFLQGFTNIIHATSDFERYGMRALQTLTGSLVPAAMAQLASELDPYARDINSMLDAIKYRIPGWRETLIASRDPFGEQIPNKERVLGIVPVVVTTESKDPVRLEASRLGISVTKAPTATELPAAGDRKIGQVKLTPEQRDIFSDVSGHLAHDILTDIVTSEDWAGLPDIIKHQIYDKVFTAARKAGIAEALPSEQRVEEMDRIRTTIMNELEKPSKK